VTEDGLQWLESLGPHRIRPGLAKTHALLASLGNPERSFRSILIAGTNGKGSTAAMTASLLRAAGVRTGLYTSPHLVDVTERVRISEADVSASALDDVLALLSRISGTHLPTYFEALTVAAFELFRRARVAVAVVEVGLGGRLDATNVLAPELSIVTNVGLDHLEVLGPTLADVAREKAGILREDREALTSADGEGLAVLRREAARLGARLFEVPPSDRTPPLAGAHQRRNLALALEAAARFAALDEVTIAKGLAAVRWPGRLQRVARPGARPLLLDGAHNVDGAEALARYLDEARLSGEIDLVFGGLADKDLASMLRLLLPRARRTILTEPESPRAKPARALAAEAGRPDLDVAPLARAVALLDADPDAREAAPILVAGSLVLVGSALFLTRGAHPTPE
jgi:dihydrofolate synthase/folylpolyglutamate synthase